MATRAAYMEDGRLVADGVKVRSTVRHGVATGLLGAATLAVWFFLIDWAAGRPLFTPTVLGRVLIRGSALGKLAEIPPSLSMTLLFTLVHGAVFTAIGILMAWLVEMLQEHRHLWPELIAAFVILQFAFVGFALTFPAVTNEVLGMPQVVIGNFFAAAVMSLYAWRERPNAVPHDPRELYD